MEPRARLALIAVLLVTVACGTIDPHAPSPGSGGQPSEVVEADVARPLFDALYEGDLATALVLYPEVVAAHRRELVADPVALSEALDSIAIGLFESFDQERAWPAAEGLWREVLALRESELGGDHPLVADVVASLGVLNYYRGTWETAESLAKRALAILENSDSRQDASLALALLDLGKVYVKQGRYESAREVVEGAVAILADSAATRPDSALALAEGYNVLAEIARIQNRYGEAERLFRSALDLVRRTEGGGSLEPHLLQNLALSLKDQGRFDVADELMGRALVMYEERGIRLELAIALHNRGEIYRVQGRLDEAEPYYERALALAEPLASSGSADLALLVNQQALLYVELGRTREASERYDRALVLLEGSVADDHPLVAQTLNDRSGLLCRQGEFAAGRAGFRRALAIREASLGADNPDTAVTLTHLARCLVDESWDNAGEASRLVDRALTLFAATSAHPWTEAEALALRAELSARAGRLQAAVRNLDAALRLVEAQRPLIGGGDRSRAEFLQRYLSYYNLMVAWLLDLGEPARAFEVAERARARVFLDQLAAGGVDLRRGIAPEIRQPLEADERRVRSLLAELQQRLAYVRSSDELGDGVRARRIAELEADLDAATREYQRLGSELRRASPLWREVVTAGGEPMTLERAQQQVVPADGMLLLYQIGHRQSFLFSLPRTGEVQLSRLEVSELVASRLGIPSGPLTAAALDRALQGELMEGGLPGLMLQLRGERGLVKVTSDPEVIPRQARPVDRLHALWRVLVPSELWPRLRQAAEVVVIPDAGLHQLPFEALVVGLPKGGEGPRYWLDDGPVVRYNASATALYNLERQHRGPPQGDSLLVVSDPAFDGEAGAGEEGAAAATRSSYLRAGGSLARLPGTAREAEAILSAFGAARVALLQGLEARESKLRSLADRRQRYLHLATHGLVDQSQSALLAALALTPPREVATSSEDDGFLQLFEIYELDLDAELAVLSACDSHVGRRIEGEGAFALSRGFLAAGARRVVASQWPVDDASTARLMGDLYRRLAAAETSGETIDYARALRDARREVRATPGWESPFFWAPFVLSGVR